MSYCVASLYLPCQVNYPRCEITHFFKNPIIIERVELKYVGNDVRHTMYNNTNMLLFIHRSTHRIGRMLAQHRRLLIFILFYIYKHISGSRIRLLLRYHQRLDTKQERKNRIQAAHNFKNASLLLLRALS